MNLNQLKHNALWTLYINIRSPLPWDIFSCVNEGEEADDEIMKKVNAANDKLSWSIAKKAGEDILNLIESRYVLDSNKFVSISLATKVRWRKGARLCTWEKIFSETELAPWRVRSNDSEILHSAPCERVFDSLNTKNEARSME